MTILVDSKLLYYNESHAHKTPLNMFGTLVSIIKQIEYQSNQAVTDIVFAYDIGKSSYRLNLWPGYKGKRTYSTLPDGFKETYEVVVKQIADALGIHSFPIVGLEADDIVSILANKLISEVVLVSSDHDWIQIPIQHPNRVKLFYVKKWQLLGYEECIEMSGCSTVEQFLIKKAVLGDTGDNIIGIPSIGPVKFKAWAEEAFKLPDEELRGAFISLCKSTKQTNKTHRDYIMEGVHSCEELYDFNMALGRIMTGVKHLTVEQKAQLNACWVIYSVNKPKVDLDKAIRLSEEHSKGYTGLFGDTWSLAGCDLSIYERIVSGKK